MWSVRKPSPLLALPFSLSILLPVASAQIGADECSAADAIAGTGAFPFDTNNPTDTGVPATTSPELQCVDLTAPANAGYLIALFQQAQ